MTVDGFDAAQARSLAGGAMRYAQDRGTDLHLAAGLPLPDRNLRGWEDHNLRLVDAACALNGSSDIDRLPILAQIAPGPRA